MDIVITWCEIDSRFRMALKDKGVTVLEDSYLYETKVECMVAVDHLYRRYLEQKGELNEFVYNFDEARFP